MAVITSVGSLGARRASSVGHRTARQYPDKKGYYETGPIDHVKRAIAILEQSRYPMEQVALARRSGYNATNSDAIQSWLMCLTFFDERVYEEDDSRLGLVGVHRMEDNTTTYNPNLSWVYSDRGSVDYETTEDIVNYILSGLSCRKAAVKAGVSVPIVAHIRRRMRKEGVL